MSIILSLSKGYGGLWAAGPDGLYEVTDQANGGQLQQTPQPQENLYCCCAIHDRVLVGGLPHGVAYSLQQGENWQAGWMDEVRAPVVTLAADPRVEHSGVILAGTDGGGVLRTINRGGHWYARNFGLRSYNVLALAWAPPAPADAWPQWQTVFACTEEGVYHSPNAGRGWKRSECAEAVYQCVALAQDFHSTGIVLAGSEGNGLFRSTDGGLTFTHVSGSPEQVNALAAIPGGWLLSDAEQLWQSADGIAWQPFLNQGALVLLSSDGETWMGTDEGVNRVNLTPEAAAV
jgi:ligand-binding sensor domain-containing protein